MDRRNFLAGVAACIAASGCQSHRYAHILSPEAPDLVGSHKAGAAVWNPLVDEAVAKLLGQCAPPVVPAAYEDGAPLRRRTVCFIGVENCGLEDLGDFKEQLYERIDSQISGHAAYQMVSRRMIDTVLVETRLRPDSLFLPANRELFAATLGQHGMPIDYLLYGKITSGTTQRNDSEQRDYLLTLEMVDIHTGAYIKESAEISKGYHKTRSGKWWNYGIFGQGDG